ncbi:D-alanyl-D-alanine carboxypeptidase [Tissierella carlieri]|uniref:D-alanyl-D-alanine carboxypeptidase n=1 Tax=Tissierella carlieri TaxID=689904 RepID=A0ABT1S5B5_9FIRM|nr:D-alanyl-D-alanine carboxypeptidase family protein [Tissierella carlieri]MBU5311073.1 D-alanyl-D-alanine carboxypeptidase [Tissierella carlieri]MCQ4921666.1 D-alanyl-D-alanine carboxypeptidase [Tissierella carlieri]
MKRRLVSIILLLIILIISIPLGVYADMDLNVNAKSALLMDVNTGAIIYKLNENDRLAPASITKVMTLLLGMEALDSGRIKLTDKVMVSEHASKMGGSTVFLEAGETQTVEDLFRAIAIRSANDASVALAEHIAGSEDIFVKMMNEKAKSLGMENTEFYNCSGLPNENHYVSAYDVALMSKELLKYDRVHEWLTTYMTDMQVGKTKSSTQTMVNTNRLIKEYEGANGIKTGSTNEAGFCLSASAKRGNLQLIAVIMGVNNSKLRFDEAKRMLDYGFANYDSISIGKKGDIIATLPVEKGKAQEVELMLARDSYILLPKGEKGNISKELVLPDMIDAPILSGDEFGELVVSIDGKEVDKIKLVSKANIDKANLFNMLNRTIKSYLRGR